MTHLLKTRSFARLADKYGISDAALKALVEEMRAGHITANLGRNIYKMRVGSGGKGKRGGSRTIIVTNLDDRWFFVFCFRKNDRANISEADLHNLKDLAGKTFPVGFCPSRTTILNSPFKREHWWK